MGLDGFALGEIVAQSARTVVRRAVRKSDGVKVVVKTLVNEYPSRHELEQLESEHAILCKLDGPAHVVRAYAVERDGDRPVIVAEDFGGEALFRGEGMLALPLDRFFAIATAVTQALESIHSCGVIHRDVKPSNVVVNWETQQIKVIDFDVALDLSAQRRETRGTFEGSLPYMSPEQTGRMNRDLDYRTDYYSLGVTFFELLTGTLPFKATDTMGWVHCHISRVPPDVATINPSVPESLARIVRKLMDKNPDDRYQSAHGLMKDLERAHRQYRSLGAEGPEGVNAGFPLGADDVPQQFHVSPKLYGRDGEVTRILEGFDAAAEGRTELVLLTGAAGVGKTALMREAERRILSQQGRVLAAHLGHADRAVPYAAFVQVLRALAKQLLTESDDRLAEWRRLLNAAVAPSGRLLLELAPELEAVLGPQPEIPALGPEEANPRFRRAVQSFIGAVAAPGAPLAILVDNVQWADPSTVDLLGSLLAARDVTGLLVIAAVRDGDAREPVGSVDRDLGERSGVIARRVSLGPLGEESLLELLTATTRAPRESAAVLAHTIHGKTGGNPFFVHELLNMLAREGAFRLNADQGRWQWDDAAVERTAASDNVVDLIAGRLQRLHPGTAAVLGVGACLGETFDSAMLEGVVIDLGPDQVAAALRDAVAEGVLLHAGQERSYRFQHARLHQAAYALLAEAERLRLHVAIGRRLLAQGRDGDDGIFAIAGHLNRGRVLVDDPSEVRRLAELNVAAAERAKQATAYAIAAAHLEMAMELTGDTPSTDASAEGRRFAVERAHAECVFLAGDPERAHALARQLAESAKNPLASASAQFLAARTLDHHARYAEEIEVIRQGLERLGIELPRDLGEIDRRIGEGIGRMQGYLAQHPVEELPHLPRMVDPAKIVAMDLLFQLIPPAIQTYPPLFVLAELIMFDLAISYGVTVASCKNFVDCAIIQGGALGDYQTAYRLAQAGFELMKLYAPAPLEAGLNFVFANFVSHWRAPYRESLEAFKRAKRIGRELGNVGHTAYAYALETQRLFAVGQDLNTCAEVVRESSSYLRQIGALGTLPAAATVAHAIAKLRGAPVDPAVPEPSDSAAEAGIRATGNGPFTFAHCQIEAMCNFILGDFEGAVRSDASATALLRSSVGIFAVADYHLFHGLILCRRWPLMSTEERDAAGVALDQDLAKLAGWAENCPENFAHKHRLLAAEAGRVRGAPIEEILSRYEESVTAAGHDFPHLRALANELQAEMWMARGQRKVARALFQEAHYLYGLWGARVKVQQMESAHPEWFVAAAGDRPETTRDTVIRSTMIGGSLDLDSAMKAVRAISGEVTRERLYARLMATIVENAGAQRGCLMVVSETGVIEVVSRAALDGEPRDGEPVEATPLEVSDDLCVEMVRVVARTGEAVVLDDASAHAIYGHDPYIRRSGVRSVLCLPVLHQGRVLAILYVENSAVTHAFAAERLQLLQLIASQAAVSITNARLYDNLEEKVAARTGELAARNMDLERAHVALTTEMKTRQAVEVELRQAQKLEAVGRLASGVAHEINTPVQFVTDSVQFLKDATTDLLSLVDKLREVQRLVLAGEPAADAATTSAEAEEELDLSYLLENMPAAFARSLDGLERVATIVRSMKEFAHPDAKQMVAVDLNRAIESTLTMARNEYKYVADIDTSFGELPLVSCHAGEINQVILNIVVNAAHAIGDVVKGTEGRGRISLRTRHDGERATIEIEDTGGGVPEAIRDRIFDPFFTTKEVGKGTGQGLAIARSVVVDKHGGELTCRSVVGTGTTFTIRLPIEGTREASPGSKAA